MIVWAGTTKVFSLRVEIGGIKWEIDDATVCLTNSVPTREVPLTLNTAVWAIPCARQAKRMTFQALVGVLIIVIAILALAIAHASIN